MARIFLDTEDLMGTARQFCEISGELGGVVARLPGDALTVMPPGVGAEAPGAVADAPAGVGQVATRLGGEAMDLYRRAVFAAIAEGEAGVAPGSPGLPGWR